MGIPGLTQWVKDPGVAVSCGVGCACSLLLWLWCRLATVALIQPLAWKLQYAMGMAIKKKKKKRAINKSDI